MYQHRSYVTALENAPDLNGMYVDQAQDGMSFRNYNGLLLLGGGGHRTGKTGGNWQELNRFAAQYYPKAAQRCRTVFPISAITLKARQISMWQQALTNGA